jgi:hypothetical protein
MISDEVRRAYAQADFDQRYWPQLGVLANALRDTLAELIELKHDSSAFCEHERVPATDPDYTVPICLDWTFNNWQAEADKQLKGES